MADEADRAIAIIQHAPALPLGSRGSARPSGGLGQSTGREGSAPGFRTPFDPSAFRRFLAMVLVGLGVHLHLVTHPDEERNFDEQTTSQLSLLLDVAAVDRGRRLGRFDHFVHERRREHNLGGPAIDEADHKLGPFLQKPLAVAYHVPRNRDLIERLRIHEDIAGVVSVQELMRPGLHVRLVELVGFVEGPLDDWWRSLVWSTGRR